MSVLVEALSLVVPCLTLDMRWPGGTDAFLRSLCRDDSPARRLCTDGTLASVSFFTPEQAEVVAAQLRACGLVEVDDDAYVDFAFIDQHHGPTMPCAWLAWRRHRNGFTYAWPADREPGDMAVPADWEPEQSRRLTRTDRRDDSARMFHLATDDATGVETWLDTATGQLSCGLPRLPGPASPTTDAPMPDEVPNEVPNDAAATPAAPIQAAIDAAIAALGYTAEAVAPTLRRLWVGGEHADYRLILSSDERHGSLVCWCYLPARVPETRRAAMAEALARLNHGLPIGNFDLDARDGELRFRYGADVEGETLEGRLVVNMIGLSLHACERFHDALMAVAFGMAEPEATIAAALSPPSDAGAAATNDVPAAVDGEAASVDVADTDVADTDVADTDAMANDASAEAAIAQLLAELDADVARAANDAATPDDVPNNVPDDVSDDVPNDTSNDVPDGMPGDVPDAPSDDARGRVTAASPADTIAGVSAAAPLPNSYVVSGTRLVAGEYPGCYPARPGAAEAERARLAALVDAGVRVVIDLTRPEDGLHPYAATLDAVAAARGVAVERVALPIVDMGVCEVPHMRRVLDTIDRALGAGQGVYVHCWGGVGRTGTVVGCWLVRHGATGAGALAEVGRLFGTMTAGKRQRHPEGSPQTAAQRAMVRGWDERARWGGGPEAG